MRQSVLTLALVAAVGVATSACATKGYVNSRVSGVNSKVDTLSQSLEETQEKTRQNAEQIGQVDQKAQAAQGAAAGAQQSANAADVKAAAAGDAARRAGLKADQVEQAQRRLLYTVVLNEEQGNFRFNSTALPDAAKARIDEVMAAVLAEPKGAYFEIEGHTDSTGSETINERIGLERAEAVKMYLYEQHKVPLHRINVVSYGETRPVAENNTSAGRAQNRRVVIRVLN